VKYGKLKAFLAANGAERIALSFEQVANVAEVSLPASAYRRAQWWQNDSVHHVQAQAWLGAGYRTEAVNLAKQSVAFVRVRNAGPGVGEMAEEYQQESRLPVKMHPAYGAMKGTFTIRDWDVTKPALDEDELAEWEANLERKFDLIEKGRRQTK
jgi:hypothetical protein